MKTRSAPASHLIIAGVTRAATTSLFHYLAAHPRVCRSTIKETRFFLGDDPDLPRLHSYAQGLERYEAFFPKCSADAARLEATPDYLFDPDAAGRIRQALPAARIVIVLREPIARLVSWYRFAQQDGRLDPAMSFAQYVEHQAKCEDSSDSANGSPPPQAMRALEQGRYSRYLPAWLEAFGPRDLLIVNHAHLEEDPAAVLRAICGMAGLDAGFYEGYDFRVHNESRSLRFPAVQRAYQGLIWTLKPLVHDRPMLRAPLRAARRAIQPMLLTLNRAQRGPVQIPDETRAFLEHYYASEPAALAQLLGLEDWSWQLAPVHPQGGRA
ncbi:MAG TPA: sulfotransferase [Phycisphaeraceae bacterium]